MFLYQGSAGADTRRQRKYYHSNLIVKTWHPRVCEEIAVKIVGKTDTTKEHFQVTNLTNFRGKVNLQFVILITQRREKNLSKEQRDTSLHSV